MGLAQSLLRFFFGSVYQDSGGDPVCIYCLKFVLALKIKDNVSSKLIPSFLI